LVRQCFATSRDDASKCAITDDEVKGDVYGDSGPLKGCANCQKLVRGLRDKYMGSQESVRTCFRQHFAKAIGEELEPCIQGKISNGYDFKIPPIPDFDEKSFTQISVIEQGVDYRIAARSRMDVCKAANPTGYGSTSSCMDNGFPGIYGKHCQAAKTARAKAVQGSCSSRFDEVKKATFQCMLEKRDDWHTRFEKIQDIVNNAKSGTECGQKISDVVGAWLNKLQTALGDCMPSAEKRDLRTLIDLGCGQVVNGAVKKNELTIGFRFIRTFLDALNDRLTMFADKNCSF